MRRYIWVIVVLIAIGGGTVWGVSKYRRVVTEAAVEKSLARLRGDYLERASWLRSNPDATAYRDEIGNLFSWYFKGVAEHIRKFGGSGKFDEYLTELEAKSGGKRGESEKAVADRKANYAATQKVFASFKDRTYAPFWTGTDKGIRLDIVSADAETVDAKKQIVLPVVLWGFPRDDKTDDNGVRRVVSNANFKFNWKLFDKDDKLIGEIPGEGGPSGRIDWPERYNSFFPPGLLLGSFALDLLPPEVKRAEITFTVSGSALTGGSIAANFEWKLEVPKAWKLEPGAQWEGATDSTRTEEEIGGPKKAPVPKAKK